MLCVHAPVGCFVVARREILHQKVLCVHVPGKNGFDRDDCHYYSGR